MSLDRKKPKGYRKAWNGGLDLTKELPPKPWTFDNCPDHHYRAMGMCPYCGDTLEAARERRLTP